MSNLKRALFWSEAKRITLMLRLIGGGLSIALLGVSATAVQAQRPAAPVDPTPIDPFRYPRGSTVYPNGAIHTPGGRVLSPSVTVPNGDGSTTYYYPNGTRITTERNAISPSGTYIRSESSSQRIRNNTLQNNSFPNNNFPNNGFPTNTQ